MVSTLTDVEDLVDRSRASSHVRESWYKAHQEALGKRSTTYIDPETGLVRFYTILD